jgi:hypothetical protein
VGRGDEADGADPPVQEGLDPLTSGGEVDIPIGAGPVVPADLVVLAVEALQVAMGEEDVADPLLPAEDRFFSPMEADRPDGETRAGPAEADCARRAIDPAIARAEGAEIIAGSRHERNRE